MISLTDGLTLSIIQRIKEREKMNIYFCIIETILVVITLWMAMGLDRLIRSGSPKSVYEPIAGVTGGFGCSAIICAVVFGICKLFGM